MALVACLAYLFTSYSSSNAQELIPGQTYYTGNVVIPTNQGGPSSWTGGVYQNNLTCWSWGDPGYCGPNPIVRPGNVINFSYGSSYIYQQQNITDLLPASTPGLQVSGYTFGFMAKNGNGWDNGQTDQLTALVRFWDTTGGRGTGNLLYGNSYNLNYKFNWTAFNFSENFTTPLKASTIGQVQYGFLGRDNNGWAGPYGPEIYNVSFSLKYSVDPCSVNVLSSPSCPGYLSAISNLTPATTTFTTAPIIQTTIAASSLPTTSDVQPVEVKVDAGGVQVSTTGAISAPDNIPESVKESQKTEESKSSPNMSLVMSVVRQVQANDRAVQAAAVQNALQEVSNAIANAQEQTNSVIESNQRANDKQQQVIATASSSSSIIITSTQQTQRAIEVQAQPIQPTQISTPRVDYSLTSVTPPSSVSIQNFNQQRVVSVEVQQSNNINLNDPVNNILQQRIAIESNNNEQKTETVSSNVQANELAGNVDIASIATTPAGFNAYINLMLKDGQLYKPDEIYKNQVTIDNARALRQLSSDRLHQQMVDQQYRN